MSRQRDLSTQRKTREKLYKVIFFDSFAQARESDANIRTLCTSCDQLNVVIKAEGNMDDKTLLDIDPKVKVFAGAAWWLIHERRQADGWYDAPR